MNASPILVAAESLADGEVVGKLLSAEFGWPALSTDTKKAVDDFRNHKPSVLVLAFRTLERSESYYLGLYRHCPLVHSHPHRTVILCDKDDLARVYDLCKQEYFDHYVLFWTPTPDTLRLPMAVHQALHSRGHEQTQAASTAESALQAQPLAKLEPLVERHVQRQVQTLDQLGQSVRQAEEGIGAAFDDLKRRLATVGGECTAASLLELLQKELGRLISEDIGARFRSIGAAIQPLRLMAGNLRDELAQQIESARKLQMIGRRSRPLVLIVDDDSFERRLFEKALSKENIDLIFAGSGAGALALMRRRKPDLVLMDVNLPGSNGIETTRFLRSIDSFAKVPIIMVTGNNEKSVLIQSVTVGAVDFVIKPFDKDLLIGKLRSCLAPGS